MKRAKPGRAGRRVGDVMRTLVVTAEPAMRLAAAIDKMRRHDVGSLPVIEHDAAVGMVTDRDIVVRGFRQGLDFHSSRVADVMTAGALTIHRAQSVAAAKRKMVVEGVRRLMVVDARGRLVGLVSAADIESEQHVRTIPRQVTFYRRLVDSQGHAHKVETGRLHLSPAIVDDEVEQIAIERFERVHDGRPWRMFADGFDVVAG